MARAVRRDRLGEHRAPHEAQLRGAGPPDRGAAAAAAARPRPPGPASAPRVAIVNVASTAGRVVAPELGRLLGEQVRARRLERRAVRARSARTASTSGSCSPGSSRPRASRPPSCSPRRLTRWIVSTPERRRRGDHRGGTRRQGRALRAAPLLARRGGADPAARARPAGDSAAARRRHRDRPPGAARGTSTATKLHRCNKTSEERADDELESPAASPCSAVAGSPSRARTGPTPGRPRRRRRRCRGRRWPRSGPDADVDSVAAGTPRESPPPAYAPRDPR